MALFSKEQQQVITDGSVTLAEAEQVLAAARQQADKLGVAYNLAVNDAGNRLVAFVRMDGAWLGSIDLAINKAYTARAFNMSTEALGKMADPGQPLFGIHTSNDGRVVIFGGGVPLVRNGQVIGSIGASGGTVSQDIQVAQAGADAFK